MSGPGFENLVSESLPKRVLLVCMVDSVHAARWAKQFDPREVEFTLFPSGPNRRVHPIFKELGLKILPFYGKLSIPLWGLDSLFGDRLRGLLLRRVIKGTNPDFIHALELQHAGYISSRALADSNIKTTFIATNYGSDIFWFQRFPKHLAKIRTLLKRVDRYSAECERDVKLAKKYGFEGEVMPVFPNAGRFTEHQINRELTKASERKVLAIKGYEGWVGRASVAVEALGLLTKELDDYQVIFYSCNARTIRLVKKLQRKSGMNVISYSKGHLTHDEMLDLFASARIYVGLSLSDGISTSLLEAMAMGAYPIQTSTACADEWLFDDQAGAIITELSASSVAEAIRVALRDSNRVDFAQFINFQTISRRLSPKTSEISQSIYF